MLKHNSWFTKFFFHSRHSSWLWLLIRVYIGWQWLYAGYEKIINPVWVGSNAGVAISGFLNGSLAKTTGLHPDVSMGYAYLIQHVALPNAQTLSYIIAFTEVTVGALLILGLFTGFAAFIGATLNFNFMFAGTVSMNPYWLLGEIFLILAWRVAGHIGLDRYVLKFLSRSNRNDI